MYFGCEFASRVAIKCNFTLLDVKRERNLLILEGTEAAGVGRTCHVARFCCSLNVKDFNNPGELLQLNINDEHKTILPKRRRNFGMAEEK